MNRDIGDAAYGLAPGGPCHEGRDEETGDVKLFRGEVTDSSRSCIAGRINGRGKEEERGCFFIFGVNCKRSKPQSFVTSHQKEYRELTSAASNLTFFFFI